MRRAFVGFMVGSIMTVMLIGPVTTAQAQGSKENPELVVPPGMEVIEIGTVKYLVPIGTEVREGNGIVTLEGLDEYSGRRFVELEERLSAIEEKLEEVIKKIEEAKKEVGQTP